MQEYSKQVSPLKEEYAKSQINIARSLASSTKTFKFTPNQKERVKDTILWLCDETFSQENIQQQEETQKLKSIRNIYISLAKILHPDTEIDPEEKIHKEEVMKQVTSAYEQKDLSTLLKLEMQWVAKTSNHLESIGDDQLRIYTNALKQQLEEIKNERLMLYNNPRFHPISNFYGLSERLGLDQIKKLR